jgi:hypothetical protein
VKAFLIRHIAVVLVLLFVCAAGVLALIDDAVAEPLELEAESLMLTVGEP